MGGAEQKYGEIEDYEDDENWANELAMSRDHCRRGGSVLKAWRKSIRGGSSSTVDTIRDIWSSRLGVELRGRGRAEGTLNVMFRHVNLVEQCEASPRLGEAVGDKARGYESGALIRGREITVRRIGHADPTELTVRYRPSS